MNCCVSLDDKNLSFPKFESIADYASLLARLSGDDPASLMVSGDVFKKVACAITECLDSMYPEMLKSPFFPVLIPKIGGDSLGRISKTANYMNMALDDVLPEGYDFIIKTDIGQDDLGFYGIPERIIKTMEVLPIVGLVFPFFLKDTTLVEARKIISEKPDNFLPSGLEVISFAIMHTDVFLESACNFAMPGLSWGGASSSFYLESNLAKKEVYLDGMIQCANPAHKTTFIPVTVIASR